jgi:hypothetical protein
LTVVDENSHPNLVSNKEEPLRAPYKKRASTFERTYTKSELLNMKEELQEKNISLEERYQILLQKNIKLQEERDTVSTKIVQMTQELKNSKDNEDKLRVLEEENKAAHLANDALREKLMLNNAQSARITQLQCRIAELETKESKVINITGMHEIVENFIW